VAEPGGDRLAGQPDLGCLRPPRLAQRLLGQVAVLRLPRGQGGDLHLARRGALAGGGEDLGAAGGEGAQLLRAEALDLGDPVADLLPAHPEPAGQLVAQVGLVDVAGGLRVFVERRVVEAGPAAVGSDRRVGDQDMGVELEVAGARGAVPVGGGEEAPAGDELGRRAAASEAGGALKVGERGLHRGAVGGDHLGAGPAAAERPGEGDRLRRREGEVEARDRAAPADRAEAERLSVDRTVAGQHRGQLLALDPAVEAEHGGGGADPVALGLALA